MGELVERPAFDEAIVGVPWLRIPDPAADGVPEAFRAALVGIGVARGDARTAVDDRETQQRLVELGFHRVCTQVTFGAPPSDPAFDAEVAEVEEWPLSEAELDAHAAGFRFSRFAQDVTMPTALAARWIRTWLANSLGGRRRVLALGPDVVTYAAPDDDGVLTIDLVSILRSRRGHGRRLIAHLRGLAGRLGAREVRVTTEAENVPAQRLYASVGFALVEARACFHLHLGR